MEYMEIKGKTKLEKAPPWQIYSIQKFPYTDLKPTINKFIHKKIAKITGLSNTRLTPPYARYHRWLVGRLQKNRKEMTLSRFCTTHSHLLKKEDTSISSMCKIPFTVKHILLNWQFQTTHPKYYQTSNLKDLFKNSKSEVMSFF